MLKYRVPKGMCDYLPDECYEKNHAENDILSVFEANGYERIETPSIEYHNVFYYNDVFPIEKAFKMTDTDGSLIILRPDITMPLARLVSTKMQYSLPLKLCYLGNSFSLIEDDYRYREFTQAGLELIGEKSYLADAEVIMLAVDALKAAGLTDFLIEVGNTEFFRGLIEECGLLKRDEEELIRNVDKKNNLAITETLKNAGTVKSLIDVITKLPTLFGDDAVKDAYGLVKNKKSLAALDEIGKLCDILRSSGYEKYVSVDLSLLNNMNFYTGTIFKGITSHFGAPILSGGRYNNLFTSAKGGEAIPATGFAVGIKNLLTALKASGQTVKKPPCDYVIGAKKKYAEKAFETKKKLTEQGFIVNYTFIDDENKLAKYAKETAARNIIFIDR